MKLILIALLGLTLVFTSGEALLVTQASPVTTHGYQTTHGYSQLPRLDIPPRHYSPPRHNRVSRSLLRNHIPSHKMVLPAKIHHKKRVLAVKHRVHHMRVHHIRHNPATPVGFYAWLNSPTAQKVVRRESHGRCNAVNPSGKYRGKWQMDRTFWHSYHGDRYAALPDQATCHEQDLVAYHGWQARGWSPWPTAN